MGRREKTIVERHQPARASNQITKIHSDRNKQHTDDAPVSQKYLSLSSPRWRCFCYYSYFQREN